jgi:hypothetical protein
VCYPNCNCASVAYLEASGDCWVADEINFKDISPRAGCSVPTAAQIARGLPVPPVRLLQIMSPDDWEAFTEEYLSFYKTNGTYDAIRRFSGPGDLGLDVIAFTASRAGFGQPWDSFQCKHYDHALEPGDVYAEVGKIIYHSFQKIPPFNQTCRKPRRHVFVTPQGVGITVGRWLRDSDRFKQAIREKWATHCVPGIGKGIEAPLKGELLKYFDDFEFGIFEDRTGIELIEVHEKTIFHAPRFGGGFPERGQPPVPPPEPAPSESVYLRKILNAYADDIGQAIVAAGDLVGRADLKTHYERQRVLFYSAESLRNFARDRTPPLTFDSLQEDVYHGVIDIHERNHKTGLERLRATVSAAGALDVGGNALASVTRVPDKQGICHQLANDDQLTWTRRP